MYMQYYYACIYTCYVHGYSSTFVVSFVYWYDKSPSSTTRFKIRRPTFAVQVFFFFCLPRIAKKAAPLPTVTLWSLPLYTAVKRIRTTAHHDDQPADTALFGQFIVTLFGARFSKLISIGNHVARKTIARAIVHYKEAARCG